MKNDYSTERVKPSTTSWQQDCGYTSHSVRKACQSTWESLQGWPGPSLNPPLKSLQRVKATLHQSPVKSMGMLQALSFFLFELEVTKM